MIFKYRFGFRTVIEVAAGNPDFILHLQADDGLLCAVFGFQVLAERRERFFIGV